MKYVKLNTLCDINIGKTPSRSKQEYWGSGRKWISIADIKSTYITDTKEQITSLGIDQSKIKLVPKDTVIMSFKLTVGKVAITAEDMYTNEAIASFPIKDNSKLYTKYLYYCLQTLNLMSATDRAVMGATLNKAKLNEIKIPYVDYDQQIKIANILDQAQELIDKRKAQIEALDELIQSVFYDMFGDLRINPHGYKVLKLSQLVSEKSDIVDGPFGSSVNTKTDYIEDGEIPVIRTKNVKMLDFSVEDLKFMTREKYETVKRSQVLPGDIILTKVGTIGNVCIFPNIYPEAVLSTTGSCRIRVNNNVVNPKYLVIYLMLYKPVLLEIASTGVQSFLNMNHVKNIDILLPDKEKQNLYVQKVSNIEKQKELLNESLVELENNFNSLMQRAFKGEL